FLHGKRGLTEVSTRFQMFKKIVAALVALVVLVLGICVVRTLTLSSKQLPAAPAEAVAIDANAAAQHLAGALKFSTVSSQDVSKTPGEALLGLHGYHEQTLPKFHSAAKREKVAEYS